MDKINTNSEVPISSVKIKEEPLDIEPEAEDLINPAENVKVELEEEEGVKLETNAAIDPLANVQAHYTGEASSSEPSSSRKRPAPSTSGQAENEDMDVITKHFKGYDQLEFVPRNQNLQSVRKGSALRLMRKYICNDCDFTTSYKNTIVLHTSKGTEEHSKCEKCDYVGINKSDLMIHLKPDHPEPYKCDLCPYTSSGKDGIRTHISRFHSTKSLTCSLCNFKTKCQTYLLAHIKSMHPKAKPYKCDACDQSFESFQSLGKHKRKEHDSQVHFCKICDFSTKNSYHLFKHEHREHANLVMESVNSGQAENEDMDVITKHFKGYDQLECVPRDLNLKSISKGSSILRLMKKYVCHDCDFTTSHKFHMLTHKSKENEENSKREKCLKCDYIGINKSDLMIHIKSNHLEVFKCDLCPYTSTYKSSLSRHVSEFHATDTISCVLCDFKTKCQAYLDVHIKSKHPGKKPYECDACDQTFPSLRSLGCHKRRDHDARTLFCNECNYTCKHHKDLIKHRHKEHVNFIVASLNSDMLI